MKRLVAALVLAALAFGLGLCVGHGREPEPEPEPALELPPSGEELWQSLPPELLANVAEGIMERISGLEADLERVGEIQREKMQNMAGSIE